MSVPDGPETESARTEAAVAEGAAGMHPAFFGPDGLRPGWGLLLFGAIYGALYLVLGSLAATLFHVTPENPAVITPGYVLRGDGFAFSAVLVTTWIMARLEGRRFGTYGLLPRSWKELAGSGAAVGFLLLSMLVAGLKVLGYLVFESRVLHRARVLEFATEWAGLFLLVAFFEETLFRGYLQVTLGHALAGLYQLAQVRRPVAWGFWTSAVLLSFGFGAVHTGNTGESWIGILAAGMIGVIFCLSLWRTGSLWWAIGFHAAWDWAQSYLFGVYDSGTLAQGRLYQTHPQGRLLLSGGLTGPEGSVLVLPTLLMMVLAILITLPNRRALPEFTEDERTAV